MGLMTWVYGQDGQVVDTVLMGGWIKAGINFIINLLMELALSLINMVMGCLTISSSMFDESLHPELGFFGEFHHVFKVIGLSMIVLIASWQIFKNFFAYMGFEAEEGWRIAIRAMVLSVLIIYSKDIIIMSLKYIFDEILGLIWSLSPMEGRGIGDTISISLSGAWESIKNTPLMPGGFLLNALLFLYLAFKLGMLCFKLAERYILVVFYTITFPLALSAEVSKSTKPYFQGWVKGFVGNLIVQISQITVFLALIKFWESGFVAYKDGVPVPLIGAIIAASMIKVLDKVEEIVRDTGMGLGFVSGPMAGPLEMAQSYNFKISSVGGIFQMLAGKAVGGRKNINPDMLKKS